MIDATEIVTFCYPSHTLNNNEIKEINGELHDLLLKRFNCKISVSAKDKYRLVMTHDISNDEWVNTKQSLISITESLIGLHRAKSKFL